MKRFLGIFLMAILLISCLPAAGAESGRAKLTLMVYITGSDLESKGGAATVDITEMLRSGVDADAVNILLMTGGSRKWWSTIPNDRVCIFRAKGRRPELVHQMEGNVSMGEADTLSFFLNYGCDNFPADRYALVLWDHGGGPMNGVCFDDLFAPNGVTDSLNMMELRAALEASPFSSAQPLEWIGFDACLMSAVETAHICAPFARYMIASQETEPGSGWDYSFLAGIEQRLGGAETARRIIDLYFENTPNADATELTLACVDLAKIAAVERAMDLLFIQLDQMLDADTFSQFSNSRQAAKAFGRGSTGSEYDLVDLYHLAAQYADAAPEAARALQAAVEAAVVYQRSNMENCSGLSVYYPYYNKDFFNARWRYAYTQLDFSQDYTRYMRNYARLWLGDALADWSDLPEVELAPLPDGVQEFTMELTDEQAEHFASAELYILDGYDNGGAYYEIYHIGDIPLEDNLLRAQYSYQALYVLDEDGNPMTDALTYLIRDDTYLVQAVLSNVNGERDFNGWMRDDYKAVYLQCRRDEETDELTVVGVIELPELGALDLPSEDELQTGKQVVTMESGDWAWIQFIRHARLLAESEDGATLAYPDWPRAQDESGGEQLWEYWSVDNASNWTLKFCEEQYGGRSLQAQYVVTDTQGSRFASALMPIENPNLVDRFAEEQVLLDDAEQRVTLSAIEVAESKTGAGMYLYMRMDRLSEDGGLSVRMQGITFDQTALDLSLTGGNVYSMVLSDEVEMVFYIPASEFPPLAAPGIHTLEFDLRMSDPNHTKQVPVHIEAELELGGMGKSIEDIPAPIAETAAGDVTYQLLNLREQGSTIGAELRIINNGTEDLEAGAWSVRDSAINGRLFHRGFRGKGSDLIVPAGSDLYTRVRFIANSESSLTLPLARVNGLDYWDIEAVDRLEIFGNSGEQRITFRLAEPYILSSEREPASQGAPLPAEGIAIHLKDVSATEDALYLHVSLQNDADTPVELAIEEALLNGSASEATIGTAEATIGAERRLLTEDELANGTYTFPSVEIDPNLAQRGVIAIPLADIGPEDALSSVQLRLRVRGADGSWQIAAPVTIEIDSTPQALMEETLSADALTVRSE